jgi:hypothetical protein
MKNRPDEPKRSDPAASAVEGHRAHPEKFELSIELDDVVAAAILDSILRAKRRKVRGSGLGRRSK